MLLSARLKKLLAERQISQKQFAADLNIAPSTIGNYIQGIREPDYETLLSIAQYFHVSIDYLLGSPHTDSAALNASEVELLNLFRDLSLNEQEYFLAQLKLFHRFFDL